MTNLVLSRNVGESVVIGSDIKVTIIEIRGEKVRLAFSAPASVPIYRQEIVDAIARGEWD